MTCHTYALAIAAAGLLAAQPCAAADDPAGWSERRIGAFAGVGVRMPLGTASRARPSARLQLSTSYNVRNLRTGALDSFKAQGLEIGAARGGGPTLHLNGRSLARSDRELALTGSTSNTVLIVLGVTLAAVTALVLITSDRAELPGPIV
jgi:hypothetical protein